MPLPQNPVTLSVAQIGELNKKLTSLRHDVNSSLSLITASAELVRQRPEKADRLLGSLVQQPPKVAEVIARFSRELEATLGITRP
jgi:hypothetical protein